MYEGWVITYDHLNEGDFEIPTRKGWGQKSRSAVRDMADQVIMPRITIIQGLEPELIKNPVRFRLIDEDGVKHYAGIISEDWLNGEECLAFSPLSFGTIDSGATIMEYCDPNSSEWKVL